MTINTDAPRFSRIYVRDDGLGMSYETLSRLVKSIGGSAKRHNEGTELGITSQHDTTLTPGGRPIIGKIGIGLFSVSQLARRFRIVTKMRGEPYRLVAEIQLRQFEEGAVDDGDDSTLSGVVTITREGTSELQAHGTDILLDDIKPPVRDILRDAERWRAVENREAAEANGDVDEARQYNIQAPVFHAGWIGGSLKSAGQPIELSRPPRLPWTDETPGSERIQALMRGVEDQSASYRRPDLDTTLDYYLGMVWSLGLAAPVPYIDGHPFDLTAEAGIRLFWLSNRQKEPATPVEMLPGQTVREAISASAPGRPQLVDGLHHPAGEFRVSIDDIELRRPVSFKLRRTSDRGLDHSILMVGRYAPDLSPVADGQSGGALALEGYLFWNGRIIPKENNGVLVRIRGASGSLFDRSFFSYAVQETTRLSQITSELFVQHGLDAALNIDRESFNFAHPHFQLVSAWLHRALRQLTNRQKEMSARLRDVRSADLSATARSAVSDFAQSVWDRRQGSEPPPEVEFVDNAAEADDRRRSGASAFTRSEFATLDAKGGQDRENREARAAAVLQILTAYGALENLSLDDQRSLADEILHVFMEIK
ncbi:hypothetical protein D3C72_683130 [compost metagenome]